MVGGDGRLVEMATLSGRTDCFPTLLVSSLVALMVTGDESIIKAARKRWLRAELDGTEVMTDRDAPMNDRKRVVRSGNVSRATTPGNSAHGGAEFNKFFADPCLAEALHQSNQPRSMV